MVVAEIATTTPRGAMKGKTQKNITRFIQRLCFKFNSSKEKDAVKQSKCYDIRRGKKTD